MGGYELHIPDADRLRPEELRTVSHPLGSVTVYGDCLASPQTVERAVDAALTSRNSLDLTTLPGSYATIIERPDGLTVHGDLAGQYPIYYRQAPDGAVALSTTAQAVRHGAGVDLVDLAARIALPAPAELLTGRSAFAGVSRLDAGHTLRLTTDGSLSTVAYETFQEPRSTDFDSAAEQLRAALLESASLRAAAGYKLSADFSGGHDSTTAAYLLAYASDRPLLTTTRYVPGMQNDDLPQVHQLLALPDSRELFDARGFPEHTAIRPFLDLLSAPLTDEPQVSSASHVREAAYDTFLLNNGIQTHVTGTAADCLFDLPATAYLGGLARNGEYLRFARSAVEMGRAALASPRGIAHEAIARSKVTPQSDMHMLARILKGSHDADVLRHGGWLFGPEAAPKWLTRSARRLLIAAAEARAEALGPARDIDYGNYSAYNSLREIASNQHGGMRDSAARGLRKRAFYLDNAILRATLGLPSHVRINPWTFKAILSRATDGLVPRVVSERSTKGDYTPHIVGALRDTLPVFQELLHDSRLAAMDIIEPNAVQESLQRITMGSTIPSASLQQYMAIEQWLRSQESHGMLAPPPPELIKSAAPQVPEVIIPSGNTYHMAADAYAIAVKTGGVALHAGHGTYYRLNTQVVQLLRALDNATFEEALTILSSLYPDDDPKVQRNWAGVYVQKLGGWGLLHPGPGRIPVTDAAATGTYIPAKMTRQNDEQLRARLRDYPAAVGGFALAMLLKRLPFDRQLVALQKVHRYWSKRPATEQAGNRTLTAVQKIASLHIGRAACLEVTTAAVLAEAIKRRHMSLTLGVATDPDSFHAWPTAGGVAVRTANDPEIVGIFDPLLQT